MVKAEIRSVLVRSYIRYSHRWGRYTIRNKFDILFVGLILSLFLFVGLSLKGVHAATSYDNGFETDTTDWTDTTRVGSGTDGIVAADGGFYAKATNDAFTRWGGYENVFPSGGYTTKLDVYLDMSQATGGGTDKRFDFSSAINKPNGDHERDFIFSLGTDPNHAGQWGASVGNNAEGWPLNPAHSPVTITDTGWYTLKSNFHDDGTGVLAVTMSIIKVSDHSVIGSWTLSSPLDVIGTTVGGHRYGWFTGSYTHHTFSAIAIDNASLELNTPLPGCSSDNNSFDTFADGSVNGQNGWSATNPNFDQEVVDNVYGYSSLGCKSLRLSNSYTGGSFGDQTFSYSTANEAGEADSTNGGKSGGTRQNHYEAQFDIASTQASEQSGLAVSVSPDRGDGSRMSYLRFQDSAAGIEVYFDDVTGTSNPAVWNEEKISTLDRSVPHTVKFVIDYLDGPSNDVVKVYIDGVLKHTGTTWENYYRYDSESSAEQTPRTTDSLLFRVAGSAAPATAGKGYLFDNVNITTSNITPAAPSNLRFESPDKVCGGFTNINYTTAAWDAVPGAVSYDYHVDGPGGLVYDTSLSGTSNSGTFGSGAEGTYTFKVRSVSASGLKSDWSASCGITYDKTSPTAPNITFPSAEQYFNTTPILNDWTNSSDTNGIDHYQLEYVYDDGHTFVDAPYRETPGSQSQRNHTPGTGEQGGVKVRVRAYDKAGNVSDWSNQVHYYYDATAPANPALVSPANNSVVNGSSITQSWSDTSSDVNHYVYESYNDAAATSLRWHEEFTSTSKTATNVANTTYWWRVKAVDNAGNESGWSPLWKITVDNTPPAKVDGLNIKVNGSYVGCGAVINQRNIIVDWNDSSDPNFSHYEYRADANKTSPYEFTTNVSASQRPGTIRDQDGTYNYQVRAIDKAGNAGDWSDWCGVTLDRQAPVAAITNPSDSEIVSGTMTISGTVTDDNPSHYYLVVKDASNNIVAGPGTVNAASVSDYSWDTTLLPDGNYTVFLSARDAANNKDGDASTPGDSVDSITVTVDNGAPVVSINSYNANSNVITPDVTATDAHNMTYSWVADDLASAANVSLSDATALEPDFTVNANGTYNFTLTVTDSAGNSTDRTFSFSYTAPSTFTPHNVNSFASFGRGGGNGVTATTGFANVTTGTPGGTGQVLAANTNNQSASDEDDTTDGEVKSASTQASDVSADNKDAAKSFNWWWLAVIAAVIILLYTAYSRRKSNNEA